ncbi:uncharacterized protein LOC135683536 [Rhopilema esculentum]|uniref:uncharacterized protein LOC135683536 n=1 Tax=Rhopilema esculentum TaxID=499914 RepID=UPI0031CF63F7
MFRYNQLLGVNCVSFVAMMAANLVFLVAADQPRILGNVFCSLQKTPVATNGHIYPYYVLLSRCQGSVSLQPPTRMRCVPIKEEAIKFQARDLERNQKVIFELKNHTQCGGECVAKPSDCPPLAKFENCQCICPSNLPESSMKCPAGRSWSKQECKCKCNNSKQYCGSKRFFDEKTCSCQCKTKKIDRCFERGLWFDHEKCKCSRHSTSTGTQPGSIEKDAFFWICLAVAEFIILLAAFQLFLYYKNKGLIYTLRNYCRGKKDSFNLRDRSTEAKKNVDGIDSRIIDEADQDVYFLHSRYQSVDEKPL